MAAYRRATRLDPAIRTSIAHSFFMAGDFERAIELDVDDPPYITTLSLLSLGRTAEAIALYSAPRELPPATEHLALFIDAVKACVHGNRDEGTAAVDRLRSASTFLDPEGLYYWALASAGPGDYELALDLLARAVETGFYCVSAFEVSPLLSSLRSFAGFGDILARARTRQEAARKAFVDADGPRLLGLPLDTH